MGDTESSGGEDGSADFSGYSLLQLQELRRFLDRAAFPLNYTNLTIEIERRTANQPPAAESGVPPLGRFSPRDGWRGSLCALRMRSPVFGAGTLEIGADEVRITGSQRTWLGIVTSGEYAAPTERIRNAALDGSAVTFEIKNRWLPARTVRFETGNVAHAQSFFERLPKIQSKGFEKRWRETRDFHARVGALGGRDWLAPVLVIANIAVYVAMLIAAKSFDAPDLIRLSDWGANYGPLTTSGQWWRLLSAMFLHGTALHLLLNMWVLWGVGRLTERFYGTATFAFLFFATGICGGLARIVWDPSIASVGASGAVFGVLGAMLAMLLHRGSGIPRSITLTHWPSTLAFTLFNLVDGFRSPLVDNAAHVGGLLSGILFGWVLVRPIDIASRQSFPMRQIAGAGVVATLIAVACFAHLRVAGGQASVPERYFLARTWYARGETENLQLWNETAMRAASGNISSAELTALFKNDIIPFWKSSHERLARETPRVPKPQRKLHDMVLEFVRLRLAWAEAVYEATEDRSVDRARDALDLATETRKATSALMRYSMRANMDQRPRALANASLVVKVRNLISIDGDRCVEEPAVYGNLPAFGDAPHDGPKARHRAGCLAQRYFVTGDYQALEDLITKSVASLSDMRDGSSTLSGVFAGIDNYFEYGGMDLEQVLGRTSDWRRSVENAVGAELVEAQLFRTWAWTARGQGYATSVSPQSWEQFAMRSDMAAAGLEEIRERAAGNPYWYQLALNIGLDQQLDRQTLDALFEEGVRRFPDYLPVYLARLRHLMPKWGGSVEEIEEFIARAAGARRSRLEPDELYARLYGLYTKMDKDELNIFAAGNADWPRVQVGYDNLRGLFPQSDVILNEYAKLACMAGDREKYDSLRPFARQRKSSTVWSEKRSMEKCDALFAESKLAPP